MAGIVTPPSGLGTEYTFMEWSTVTDTSSNQYKLRETTRSNGSLTSDSSGFYKVGNRYVVAMTTTYGNVGDCVNITMSNGRVIPAIIGDIKNQNDDGCNQWGHKDGNAIVEWVTAQRLPDNPPSDGSVVQVENLGNYFTNPELANTGATATGFFSGGLSALFEPIVKFTILAFIAIVGVYFALKAFDISMLDVVGVFI